MMRNRWVAGAFALAVLAGGVMVATPAAQAAGALTPCASALSDASSNLDWGSYDITLNDYPLSVVLENAQIAQNSLLSPTCDALQSSIGSEVAAALADITGARQSIIEDQRTAASKQLADGEVHANNAFNIVFFS